MQWTLPTALPKYFFRACTRSQSRLPSLLPTVLRQRDQEDGKALCDQLGRPKVWITLVNELGELLRDRGDLVAAVDIGKKLMRHASRANNSPSKLSGNRGNSIGIPADADGPRQYSRKRVQRDGLRAIQCQRNGIYHVTCCTKTTSNF